MATRGARQLIEDPANARLLSMASVWEMALKASMGRLTFAQPFATVLQEQLQRNSMHVLDITVAHTGQVATIVDPRNCTIKGARVR